MASKTRDQLNSEADSHLPDNEVGAISPEDLRDRQKDLADSALLEKSPSSGITAGYLTTAYDAGTKSSGTFKPDPEVRMYQKLVNNGAFTLAAPDAAGCYTMSIDITNGSSAGAITFTGFLADFPKGDDLTTTDGDTFKLHIHKSDAGVTGMIEALQ